MSTSHKILVIQQGWVLVGDVAEVPNGFKVTNGAVIRRWGTTAGLGQLALHGKQNETVLDEFGDATVPSSSLLFSITCKKRLT